LGKVLEPFVPMCHASRIRTARGIAVVIDQQLLVELRGKSFVLAADLLDLALH
jgi:hypothetical protein